MDDPVRDVETVIRGLTQTVPSVQRTTIDEYFTVDAEFIHPFCRTGSYTDHGGSRGLVHGIYRWYKILSPSIDLTVDSVGMMNKACPMVSLKCFADRTLTAYDASNLILYVTMHQIFRIWFIPFYSAPVKLTTVLKLCKMDSGKFLIKSQEDLYQFNEWTKFCAPGLHYLLALWQLLSSFICVLCAMVAWPVTYIEEHGLEGVRNTKIRTTNRLPSSNDAFIEQPKGSGNFVTPPAIQKR